MRDSKTSAVLNYMKTEGSITSLQAFHLEKPVTRLADVIFKLKKRGFKIGATYHSSERYAKYFLID